MNPEVSRIKQQLAEKNRNYNQMQRSLLKSNDHADRMQAIREINSLIVDIRTLRYKLANLKKNEPLLGYTIEENIRQATESGNKKRNN